VSAASRVVAARVAVRTCIAVVGVVLTLLLSALAVTAPVQAQQQTATRFMRVADYPITIEYATSDDRVATEVRRICEATVGDLAYQLGLMEVTALRVVLVDDMDAFQRRQGIQLPTWGVAFAFMGSQVMVVDVDRAADAWNTLEKTIPHELSHLLVAQRVGEVGLPVWFVEGLAQWQAGQWSLIENWRLMESVWTKRAPQLGRIVSRLPVEESSVRDAYRVSYLAFSELLGEEPARLDGFLGQVKRRGDFGEAFEREFGTTTGTYYASFDRQLYQRYNSRLLLFQTGPLFSVMAFLFLFVFLRIRMRNRRKLKQMEAVDDGLAFDEDAR
jgi:hypothetical protein